MDEAIGAGVKRLGPAGVGWLAEVGVRNRGDLGRVGAVAAYRLIRARQTRASLKLLYSLQAALDGVHWSALPAEARERLRREAEA